MDKIMGILTGSWAPLKGKRTYVLAVALAVNAVVIPALVGDVSFLAALQGNWEQLAVAFGLVTAAQH